MKPSSIVFISVGIVMVIAGLLLCSAGNKKAAAADYDLFEAEYDQDGNTVKSYDFSDDSGKQIKKLAVQIDGVDVEIIGGQPYSKIDVYNMSALQYTCSVSSQVMTISNHFDLSLLIDSGGNAFSFNGIRKYFDKNMLVPREKYIKIYIADTEDLAQIELDCMNCSVTMVNVSSKVDLLVGNEKTPCRKADITIKNMQNTSSVVTYAENCTLNYENMSFISSTATLTDTEFTFIPSYSMPTYGVSVVTGISGDIIVNGMIYNSGSYISDYIPANPCLTVYQSGGTTNLKK